MGPEQSEKQRLRLELQMNRAKNLFMWGDITEDEYRFELTQLRARLAEMKLPQHHQVFAAGDFLQNFGLLWKNATLSERKRLLTATVDEAFVTDQRVTALRSKVAFYLAIQSGLQAIPRHVYVVRSRRGTNPHDVYTRTVCINGISINPSGYCNTSLPATA